ncbi:unnamed protein product [Owenia fusiformis]|uniref:Uncharacterized protein n=1 Tax=Owenia fusiformis TaxID=6347 RepID=A0A8J1UMG1_OWEFU|nr:unnamed protein product [Owenia fusiformis]
MNFVHINSYAKGSKEIVKVEQSKSKQKMEQNQTRKKEIAFHDRDYDYTQSVPSQDSLKPIIACAEFQDRFTRSLKITPGTMSSITQVTKKSTSSSSKYGKSAHGEAEAPSPASQPHRTFLRSESSVSEHYEVDSGNAIYQIHFDSTLSVCNTFWRPALTFSPYKYGDMVLEFGDIWPDDSTLPGLMKEAFQMTALRRSVLEICKLVLRCGPLRVLKLLLEQRVIGIDQVFENGSSMLHIACIARNSDAVQHLCSLGINPKIQDKYGRTADQVLFCPKIRKLLPARYLMSPPRDGRRSQPPASMHDKETMFQMAHSVKDVDELEIKLQTLDFDVNSETNSKGDYLIHVAAREGLSQMSFLRCLARIQDADIELQNAKGMTALMIASEMGDAVLVDVLLCLIGSNPNTPNRSNGWTALHYSARENQIDVANCLTKRGADFNLEDFEGRRADDIAKQYNVQDCREVIEAQRVLRIESLSQQVQQGELTSTSLRVTDLFNVDREGNTLIMAAATHNQCDNLELLIQREASPIDAQHERTGRTALTMAAMLGHEEAVRLLLKYDANPSIRDIDGYLSLHYAVQHGHCETVRAILKYPRAFMGLATSLRLTNDLVMQSLIKDAINRRQVEIVNPELFECALTGNAQQLFCVLEEGDSVNPSSGVGDWPLYLAAENGHIDVIKLLYEKGGDVRRQHPNTRNTLLHVASSRGHLAVVKYLVQFCKQNGYNTPSVNGPSHYRELHINVLNNQGKTALQLAAEKGYSKIVKELLNHGATTVILGPDGQLFSCMVYQGIQVLIETHREKHTTEIMNCIQDTKARKSFSQLKKIWQPRFDHNLRDKSGDSPLMVSCSAARLDILKFLLESAVYDIEGTTADSSYDGYVDDSDNDSGVLEITRSQKFTREPKGVHDDVSMPEVASDQEPVPSAHYTFPFSKRRGPPESPTREKQFSIASAQSSAPPRSMPGDNFKTAKRRLFEQTKQTNNSEGDLKQLEASSSTNMLNSISTMFDDITKQRAGVFTSDKMVSHVCAVNAKDGATALHRTIQSGDHYQIILLLVECDQTCVNIQDDHGLSPIHLACKLGRRKIVEKLTAMPYVDLNSRTLDGKLPEEMTTNKLFIKLITDSRLQHPYKPPQMFTSCPLGFSSNTEESPSVGAGTSVDFDKINTRFQMMKSQMGPDLAQ